MPFSSTLGNHLITALLLIVGSTTLVEPQVMPSDQTEPATTTEERTSLPRSSQVNNVASVLQHVVSRMQREGMTAANVAAHQPETYTTPLVRVDLLGRLHTAILVTRFDVQAAAALAAQHVQLDKLDASARVVQAWVPFDRLETVAALPFVRYLRPPRYARRR